ncbi:hypothetical protein K040078D81_31050 [Blautia hominis]|uniref:Uncharacterized protein n=1 Tax=Blautia hominis TaxID=2025493 RepID=A0ABQ0BBZ5_9FIRM
MCTRPESGCRTKYTRMAYIVIRSELKMTKTGKGHMDGPDDKAVV